MRKLSPSRYAVTLSTSTTVYIEAHSIEEAKKIALERAQGDEWWLAHREDLRANLEPVAQANLTNTKGLA